MLHFRNSEPKRDDIEKSRIRQSKAESPKIIANRKGQLINTEAECIAFKQGDIRASIRVCTKGFQNHTVAQSRKRDGQSRRWPAMGRIKNMGS